jgi:2'-5' RNA ligase
MLIAQLILQVEQPNPGVKNKQPLLATLADASAAIERGNTTVALNQLSAFQNKVRAQVAPANAALADDLVAIAQQILVAVSGP